MLSIRQRRIVAPMFTFIESSAFERICPLYLDDDEYAELQQFMMQNPETRSGRSRLGWRSETRLGAAGHGQARRATSHPFRTVRTERVLDVDDLCQGQARRGPRAYSEAVVRGIPK